MYISCYTSMYAAQPENLWYRKSKRNVLAKITIFMANKFGSIIFMGPSTNSHWVHDWPTLIAQASLFTQESAPYGRPEILRKWFGSVFRGVSRKRYLCLPTCSWPLVCSADSTGKFLANLPSSSLDLRGMQVFWLDEQNSGKGLDAT